MFWVQSPVAKVYMLASFEQQQIKESEEKKLKKSKTEKEKHFLADAFPFFNDS